MKSADNSAKNIVPFPSREAARRNREEVAFLPAALEIVESSRSLLVLVPNFSDHCAAGRRTSARRVV